MMARRPTRATADHHRWSSCESLTQNDRDHDTRHVIVALAQDEVGLEWWPGGLWGGGASPIGSENCPRQNRSPDRKVS